MIQKPRLASLDGLRGIAALTVAVHHCLLLIPALLIGYRQPVPDVIGTLTWWLTYTPLHLLWDGGAAVTVFFVLSGFVLCLPVAQGRAADWRSYYPQRLIRLYLPVWAAIGFAALVIVVMPHSSSGVTDWVSGHPTALNTSGVVNDLILVWNPGFTNSALWTLQWEVLFSLLLPVFVVFGSCWARKVLWKFAILATLMLAGALLGPTDRPYQLGALYQLPIFGVGVLLAFHWDEIRTRMLRLTSPQVALLWTATVVSLSAYWLAYSPGAYSAQPLIVALARVVQVGGAATLVLLTARDGVWSSALNTSVLRWLGTRSFSLYLVHEPVVVAAGNLAGLLEIPAAIAIACCLVIALLLTEVFFRLIEKPSHLLARQVGSAIRRKNEGAAAV